MVTVGEIISKTNFDEVWEEYIKHYEETHRTKVTDVFMQFEDGHQAYRNLYPDDYRVIAPSQFGKRPQYLRKFLVKCLKKGEK